MRCGCLFSDARNMAMIRKAQSPYSVNSVAAACALEAIADDRFVKRYAAEVLRARRMLCSELDRMGWRYYPSEANFVLVNFGGAAPAMRRSLGAQGILVRDRSYEVPGCVRITVGTMAQTRRLVEVLRQASKEAQANITATASPRAARKRRA